MPLSDTTKKALVRKAQLILYGVPIGKNAPSDTPVIGVRSLAQVVVNRCDSIAKNREEFKYLIDVVTEFIKELEGKTVSKIKMDMPTKSLFDSGLIDQYGYIIKKPR